MSYNQSRSDRPDSHYRRTGRFAGFHHHHRPSAAGFSKGPGHGPGHGPSPSPPIPSSTPSYRRCKRPESGQGGQSRSNSSESASRNLQNGDSGHWQPLPGRTLGTSNPPDAAKQAEPTTPLRSSRAVPKAPTSQSATPGKGDDSKAFPFQFGSLSPGLMNRMQIPARTSSAPPNIDEQKRDQSRRDSSALPPNLPIPGTKQQAPRKDDDLSNNEDAHAAAKEKNNPQVLPVPLPSPAHKSPIRPISMAPMQMPFHRQQVPVQFAGPNLQMQPQGVAATSLQMAMPMPLSMATASQVQQPVFLSGLQTHPIPHQGIMHQGRGLAFATQMGTQLPPQVGHMGLNMGPQYSQQQGGKFGSQRKTTVKITHPDTHEELKLDKRADVKPEGGSAGLRPRPNFPHQSQPVPSFSPSQPINYFPSTYSSASVFFPPGSVPLASNQMTPNSQAPGFSCVVGQNSQNIQFANPSGHAVAPGTKLPTSAPDSLCLENVQDAQNSVSASSGAKQVTVKPSIGSAGVKTKDSSTITSPTAEKVLSPKSSEQYGEVRISMVSEFPPAAVKQSMEVSSAASSDSFSPNGLSLVQTASTDETGLATSCAEDIGKDMPTLLNSTKDLQDKPGTKAYVQTSYQGSDHGITTSVGTSEAIDANVYPDKDLSSIKANRIFEGLEHSSSGISGSGEGLEEETQQIKGKTNLSAKQPEDNCFPELSSEFMTSKSPELSSHSEQGSDLGWATGTKEKLSGQTSKYDVDNTVEHCQGTKDLSDSVHPSIPDTLESTKAGSSLGDTTVISSDSPSKREGKGSNELAVTKSSSVDQQYHAVSLDMEVTLKQEENVESSDGDSVSVLPSDQKDKATAEMIRGKSTSSRGKKKRKEILQKADAAGSTSDLYMAYKGPEERKGVVTPPESTGSFSPSENMKQASRADCYQNDVIVDKEVVLSKAEPDDWEEAADLSTPKVDHLDDADLAQVGSFKDGRGGSENTTKKYSKDFLLKFADQYCDLPQGFEITSDIADSLMNIGMNGSRDLHSSSGRVMDRQVVGHRADRRSSHVSDNDRWNKFPSPFAPARDLALEFGCGSNIGFRPTQGATIGVLRNLRAQPPVQYAGGILSGPAQSIASQGGLGRNNSDADRWQRAANFQQRGLIPPPRTPMQMMHRAEKKYEVGKVADEEEAKQRRLKAILNKLTPQNFDKLFEQVKEVNIDNAVTLIGVMSQIFDKALMEPTFCEMYANFCHHLARELPEIDVNNEKTTFRRLLLNKCQEEFERGEREEEEANKVEEGEAKKTPEEREEKRLKARRRMLGNIRLIGELYKKKMLTERIMHGCIQKLLGEYQNPDEENIEALCKLLSTIGEMIDHQKAKDQIDFYFERMTMLSDSKKLSSRVRFMLKDAIDLRKNKWQQRRKVEGPKKIEEVHRDAAQERQIQSSRLSRGPNNNPSGRRGPMDFGPRGSNVFMSPNAQISGFRGSSPHVRGFGNQEVRFEERMPYESRTLSVPLPQRHMIDDSITLGPQGGLGRGMSIRGQPSMLGASGLNGFGPAPDRLSYSSRDDISQRLASERYAALSVHEPLHTQDRGLNFGSRDAGNTQHSVDRPVGTSSTACGQGSSSPQNVPVERVLSCERLQDMSMATIKEFYSARDEKEVALCIKDLNASSFHPTMVSLWVTDSFERKDVEINLLAKLLVNLVKSDEGILSQEQLMQGFAMVLTTLEDTVNDAPKAAEYLGRMFGKVITEKVTALREIGQLIKEGGEEQGRLVEIGLGGDVLGSTLEAIKAEKGESALKEMMIRTGSGLRLEEFRPLKLTRSSPLDRFF